MSISCIEMMIAVILFPKQFWYWIGIFFVVISGIILLVIDNNDQKEHMDKYVDSYKKKIEILDDVLRNELNIKDKNKICELINIYQNYIDKENKKEEKRNKIIAFILSGLAGVLTISFENMGIIGMNFSSWIYGAVLLIILVAIVGSWIYLYSFTDVLRKKYEMMIKDLKDLLLMKY